LNSLLLKQNKIMD